ncbi:MAG: GTPase HflX [Rhodocyclaceae bacterium]|nr:GTPase HflX [Rhodocyclaceae bacterium]
MTQANLAVLVQLDFGDGDAPARLAEFVELAKSAGAEAVATLTARARALDPATFLGRGKVEELKSLIAETQASLVLINHELSASQQRNLERALGCRVVDRSALILDIFAQRAKSHEGKLQVELAQLEHQMTRLVRGWTHLERQRGGIGLRGPGEKQLETDRRLLSRRIAVLKERLRLLERQRAVRRQQRNRREVLSVSLVGYTNAGKSTLFNALTHAGAYAADQLFATLDTTTRRLYVPSCELADGRSGCQIVLSDTVGFIRDLPHELVAAFHATLEETREADLLLHVVDAASPDRDQQIAAVGKVLEAIGADRVPAIVVLNKIDLTPLAPGVERDECGNIARVRVSAATGAGLDLLRAALAEISMRMAPRHEAFASTVKRDDHRFVDVTE